MGKNIFHWNFMGYIPVLRQSKLRCSLCLYLWCWQRRYSSDEVSKAFEAASQRTADTDVDKPTLFSRIVDRSIPAKIVYEDDRVSMVYVLHTYMQCESKKSSPLKFSDIFSQTISYFWAKFYTPIIRSYLRWTANVYSITCNFDDVMPY